MPKKVHDCVRKIARVVSIRNKWAYCNSRVGKRGGKRR